MIEIKEDRREKGRKKFKKKAILKDECEENGDTFSQVSKERQGIRKKD